MYKELYHSQVISLLTYIVVNLFTLYGKIDSSTYITILGISIIWIIWDFLTNRYYKIK